MRVNTVSGVTSRVIILTRITAEEYMQPDAWSRRDKVISSRKIKRRQCEISRRSANERKSRGSQRRELRGGRRIRETKRKPKEKKKNEGKKVTERKSATKVPSLEKYTFALSWNLDYRKKRARRARVTAERSEFSTVCAKATRLAVDSAIGERRNRGDTCFPS